MFNQKKYFEVNREERHFGFILLSEVLNNDEFRNRLFSIINEKLFCNLNPNDFEIYSEVAALRDYFFDLGDSVIYTKSTHQKRFELLSKILSSVGYPELDINSHDVFWTTKNIETRKLWSPSNWNIEKIKKLEKRENDLVSIRWCFNAKPDFMIDCHNHVVFLELKVESGEGANEFGYSQFEIQKKISDFMKLLIPEYQNSTFFHTTLQLKSEHGNLSWKEVIDLLNLCRRDSIAYKNVQNSLKQLLRYYNK
jgi:hypothetical protein